MRYAAQGFQTRSQWESTPAGLKEMMEHDKQAEERWLRSWSLFSLLSELYANNPHIHSASNVTT